MLYFYLIRCMMDQEECASLPCTPRTVDQPLENPDWPVGGRWPRHGGEGCSWSTGASHQGRTQTASLQDLREKPILGAWLQSTLWLYHTVASSDRQAVPFVFHDCRQVTGFVPRSCTSVNNVTSSWGVQEVRGETAGLQETFKKATIMIIPFLSRGRITGTS